MDYLVVLLGGRVTEHLVFGQITTGASDDLRKVHEISRSMVTDYGMGSEMQSKQLPADDYSMADATRRLVDEEQQFIADQAHRRALAMVSEHRALLEALVAQRCWRTRCSSAATSSGSWPSTRASSPRDRAWSRSPAGPSPGSPRRVVRAGVLDAAGTMPAKSTEYHPRAVFGEIDHIGVAVEDLDDVDRPLPATGSA